MKNAYNELVNYKELPNHPKNMVLNIFKPYKQDGSEDDTHQNLSAKFVPSKTLVVKLINTKKEISKETTVKFSKQDILGKELKGAKLQIKEKETGKVVKEWTSGETPETVAFKPGKYEFVEIAAPKGYKIASSIDFEIKSNGDLEVAKESLKTVGNANIIVMVDEAIEETKKENKVETKKETNREIRKENNSNPKTGDEGVASFVAILLISVTAFFVSRKKEIK